MSEEKDFFKTCLNIVTHLEVTNKSQAIAKEVVLSEIENLQQENKQLRVQISAREEICRRFKKNLNKLTACFNEVYSNYDYFSDDMRDLIDNVDICIENIKADLVEKVEDGD